MTNPADRAQEIELDEYQRNQAKAILPAPERPSAKWCAAPGCGDRIPDARRKAVPGVQFCVECQEFNEWMEGK
ncbi:MAG TPA: TraR/DksA C4-type zinc finger protein [Gallionella sp.]|nr:TraR/DksA C4-type zinc finger protein [Gallionella sp.]